VVGHYPLGDDVLAKSLFAMPLARE
jgi:hypothetical protein